MTAAAAGDGHHSPHAEQHDPHHRDYGSGAAIGAVGLVLTLGLGLILLGIVFTIWQRAKDPASFRGETLVTDTAALVVED